MKEETITFRLSSEEKKHIEKAAAERNLKTSQYIRMVILEAIDSNNSKKKPSN